MCVMSHPLPPVSPRDAGRRYSLLDRLIAPVDEAARTIFGVHRASRPYPAASIAETVDLPSEKREAAALMRVNHAGEVAA